MMDFICAYCANCSFAAATVEQKFDPNTQSQQRQIHRQPTWFVTFFLYDNYTP
jgi:hypothetical protein